MGEYGSKWHVNYGITFDTIDKLGNCETEITECFGLPLKIVLTLCLQTSKHLSWEILPCNVERVENIPLLGHGNF